MVKYKYGQFISTPFGRMRVKKPDKRTKPNHVSCCRCELRDFKKCTAFENMYNKWCQHIIPSDAYLIKV